MLPLELLEEALERDLVAVDGEEDLDALLLAGLEHEVSRLRKDAEAVHHAARDDAVLLAAIFDVDELFERDEFGHDGFPYLDV